MIAAHCPVCQVRQLYSYSRLAVHNTHRGIELVFHCYCGTRFHQLTGARARHAALESVGV